jgi:ketosteroid isomerase-like protein
MSQENVELVRRQERAHNERDINAMLAGVHPDVEIELIGGFADVMGQRTFSGPEGIRRFFTDWFATFKTVSINHEKLLEAGEDIVVLSKLQATVEGSDIPVELPIGSVYSFRDGKISRFASYYDPHEALEAVGLSVQDAHADS